MKDNRQILEALKARAKEAREKAIADGRPIPSSKNPLIEKIKAAREKAVAEGKVTPRPQMSTKIYGLLKKMREAQMKKLNPNNTEE